MPKVMNWEEMCSDDYEGEDIATFQPRKKQDRTFHDGEVSRQDWPTRLQVPCATEDSDDWE